MNLLLNTSFFDSFQSILAPWQGNTLPFIEILPHKGLNDSKIQWTSCEALDLGFNQSDLLFPIQCAELNVPLDYTDHDNPQMIQLQLLRVEATKQPSKGSVIINPGGPGESGCDYLALRASRFHAILGGDFDLVSFDPRGTGNTAPFSCSRPQPAAIPLSDVPKLYQRRLENVLDEKWGLYEAAANDCFETQASPGRYMSTAFTARDMLQIVEKLDEDSLLRYWGSSYGTILGMTFASMFPERVDRILLDAVVNPHEYMAGSNLEMLVDADKTFYAFCVECLAAPADCVLASVANNAAELSAIVSDMLQSIAIDSPQHYRDLKNDLIYRSLYWPTSWSELGAKLLLELSKGATQESSPSSSPEFEYNKGSAAVFGTRCADSALRAHSPQDLTDLLIKQAEISSFADVNIATSLVCAAWNIEPAERYDGNFTARTRRPILFVNGMFDPAASVASARNASCGFTESVVLLHNGYGHGLGAHPNLCVGRAIRRYFRDGELPAPGTVCSRESGPFEIDPRAWQNNPALLDID